MEIGPKTRKPLVNLGKCKCLKSGYKDKHGAAGAGESRTARCEADGRTDVSVMNGGRLKCFKQGSDILYVL